MKSAVENGTGGGVSGKSSSSSKSASASAASSAGTAASNFWKQHDIFAYNPTYEWTSYKTMVGSVLSWLTILFVLFYIVLTLRDYIVRPPELFSQGDIDLLKIPPEQDLLFAMPKVGFRVAYVDANNVDGGGDDDDDGSFGIQGEMVNTTTTTATTEAPVLVDNVDRTAALENENPYVRFSVRHVWYRNQERVRQTKLPLVECVVSNTPSLCPDIYNNATTTSADDEEDEGDDEIQYPLQGTFFKQDYQYLEINVNKCIGDDAVNGGQCAPLEEINSKIHNGTLRIRVQVSLEAEQFDVEQFHQGRDNGGVVLSNRSFDFFGLPDLVVQSDLVLKARIIQKEQRYIGSPPMPETETNVLSFDRKEITYRPRTTNGKRLMSFYIRLDDNVSLEEVAYWCPSILDLVGLWGAMASFAASLSFGFIAMQYNKWRFHRHFAHVTQIKKNEARKQTLAAMEWIRNNNNTKKKDDGDDTVDGDQAEETAPDDGSVTAMSAAQKRNRNKKSIKRDMIYGNLQAQYDALMVEPDIRLFESHHFDRHGRVAMSAAELKHPSTAFGELRKLALMEHGRKKRAAEFLSLWYAGHLAKRGFFRSKQERLDAIFASSLTKPGNNEHEQYASQRKINQDAMVVEATTAQPSDNQTTWSKLRHRFSQNLSSSREQSIDVEKGTQRVWRHRNSGKDDSQQSQRPLKDNVSTESASDKEHATQDVDVENMNDEQQRAAEAISAMDLAV